MNVLGLDIGRKRTGAAFAETRSRVPVSLDTLHHENDSVLVQKLSLLIGERHIGHLVIGLPLLPGGADGEEALRIRNFANVHLDGLIPYTFIDERYTTPKGGTYDGDSAAALAILTVYLDSGNS